MKTIALFAVAIFLASCGGKADVVYDMPLDQMVERSRETGEDFCIVLSRPDCPPCAEYVKAISDGRGGIPTDVAYNVVDASQPENRWYTEWLCLGTFPTTCLFTSEGKLQAVIPGTTRSSVDCLESAIGGDVKCADYLYNKHYQVQGDYLALLNDLLRCKQNLEAGHDIGAAVDACLARTDYPYPVWLKAKNEQQQERADNAVALGHRLLAYDNNYYYYIYGEVFTQARYMVNPNYTPSEDAILSLTDEIRLSDCRVGEARMFSIEATNTGKFPLLVRDVSLSCTCLELLTPARFRLEPGESSRVDVAFTAEDIGEFYREVIFFSDAAENMQRVGIRAEADR